MIWIASQTVGVGGAASVTFSNIPQTFAHLQLRYFTRTNFSSNSHGIGVRLNGDSASNYFKYHVLFGDGSSAQALSGAVDNSAQVGDAVGGSASSNIFCSGIVDLLDYANTSKNSVLRSFYGFDLNGAGITALMSSMWLNTAAVNTISVIPYSGSFVQNTRFDLYGLNSSSVTGA